MKPPVAASFSVISLPREREAVLERPRGRLERGSNGGALLRHAVDDLAARLGQGLGQPVRPVVQVVGQGLAGLLEGVRDLPGLALERHRDAGADLGDADLDLLARAREPLDELDAARCHVVDDALAGAAERQGDLLAALLDRTGNPVACGVDGAHDPVGCLVEVVRQVLMRVRDGAAHALGVADDGLALGHELVDEGADADLVVGIGAFEGRDLASHQRLELSGAGERPLDAVADGGDLPADGLGDGKHRVGGEILRLGETHRHLAHRAGDELHLLRADREHRRDEEQDDGSEEDEAAERELHRRVGGEQAVRGGRALREGEGGEAADPEDREKGGVDVGAGRGADLQRVEHHADALAVVVGDRGTVGRHEGGTGRLPLLEIEGVGRRLDGESSPRPRNGPLVKSWSSTSGRVGSTGRRWTIRLALARVAGDRVVQVQSLLDRRQSRFRRVLQFLFRRHDPPSMTQPKAVAAGRFARSCQSPRL